MFFNLNKIMSVFIATAMVPFSASAQQTTYPSSAGKTAMSKEQAAAASSGSSGTPSTTSIDAGSKLTDTNEAEAGGLEAVKKQFDYNYSQIKDLHTRFINDTKWADVESAYKQYDESWKTCVTGQKVAAYACLSNLSPNIQDAVAGINTLAAAASASSVNDSCSTFGKAMGVAQAALTAYTAACGSAKGYCGWYCSSSRDAVKKLNEALSNKGITCKIQPDQSGTCNGQLPAYVTLQTTMKKLANMELVTTDIKSISGKTEVCTGKYVQLALSAATGIYGIVNALKQGKSCDEASSADSSTATSTAETCAIEANANLPECICLKNPMLEGCGSVAAKASMSSTGSGLSALSATGSGTGTDGLTAADLATGSTTSTAARDPSSSSGSTGVGAPTGGGGANLSGSGGFGGGASGTDDKSGHKALDTNILAGSGGGGGGGGGMWGGGSDSSDKSGLRSYLPGGAKDPLKMGGQQNTSKEVTGQGGKSNWEKVRDRYQDNKSSLLNN